MKDWQGNDILDGMEVCWILINRYMPKMDWFYRGRIEEIGEESNEPCWEVGEYMKVSVGENGRPMYNKTVKDGNITYHFTDYLDSPFLDTTNNVLAIKGISDKQPI